MKHWPALAALAALTLISIGAGPRRAGMRYPAVAGGDTARALPESTILRRSELDIVSWGKVALFFGAALTDICARDMIWVRDSTVARGWWPATEAAGRWIPPHPRDWGDRWVHELQLPDSTWIPWNAIPDSGKDEYLELALGSSRGALPLHAPAESDTVVVPPPPPPPPGIPPGCIDPARQMRYDGAVRVPECWHGHEAENPNTFEYGGAQLAFCPKDGGSLYMSGYLQGTDMPDPNSVHGGFYGRLSIPAPRLDAVPEHLPLCSVLDSLADYDGRYLENMALVVATQRLGDLFWLDALPGQTSPHVYLSVWAKYQAPHPGYNIPTFFTNTEDRTYLSHIWSIGPRQTHEDRSDPFFMWKHSDFLFRIPRWWADAHAGGAYLAIGNGNRDGGHVISNCGPGGCAECCPGQYQDTGRIGVHLGPGFALIDPAWTVANLADSSSVPARAAAGYYESPAGTPHHVERAWTDPWELPNPGGIDRFQDLDLFGEGAWISDHPLDPENPVARSAVVFVVQKATHQCDYSNPSHCYGGPDACGLREGGSGYVSGHLGDGLPLPDVRAELWFFDPADYARVLAGTAPPWSPRAYAKLDLTPILYQTRAGACPTSALGPNLHIGGVAYDPDRCRLYVSEGWAWTNPNDHSPKYPAVHCMQVVP